MNTGFFLSLSLSNYSFSSSSSSSFEPALRNVAIVIETRSGEKVNAGFFRYLSLSRLFSSSSSSSFEPRLRAIVIDRRVFSPRWRKRGREPRFHFGAILRPTTPLFRKTTPLMAPNRKKRRPVFFCFFDSSHPGNHSSLIFRFFDDGKKSYGSFCRVMSILL